MKTYVSRYNVCVLSSGSFEGMDRQAEGEWVRHDDYAALQQKYQDENRLLRTEIHELNQELDHVDNVHTDEWYSQCRVIWDLIGLLEVCLPTVDEKLNKKITDRIDRLKTNLPDQVTAIMNEVNKMYG